MITAFDAPTPTIRPATGGRASSLLPNLAVYGSLHVLLGLAPNYVPAVGTAHALAVLVVGVPWALMVRNSSRLLVLAAYISACDVFWRATDSAPLWEWGKYAAILCLLLALLRARVHGGFLQRWALVYLAGLAVSIPLTIAEWGYSNDTREALSFNLAGPVTLGLAVLVACTVARRNIEPRALLFAVLGPSLATASYTLQNIASADSIRFSVHSSFVLSGGYGPNQVSLVLGAGALAASMLAFTTRKRQAILPCAVIAAALLSQSILTFSRGGPLTAVLAAGFLALHLVTNARTRTGLLVVAVLATATLILVLPRLNTWSHETLGKRYQTLESTGRSALISEDLQLFRENPLLGVGPGLSPVKRSRMRGIAAHTEFTRMLAEHGLFGLLSLVALVVMGVTIYRRAPSLVAKGFCSTWMAWSLLAMSHAATRLALISLVFAVGAIRWSESE